MATPIPPPNPNSDHFAFDDSSINSRKHRKIRLPESSATPYTPLAGEGVIYSALDGDGNTYLFWRRDTLTVDYPMVPTKVFGSCSVPAAVLLPNSFGISGVVRLASGQYRFDFSQAFADTNYTVICSPLGTFGTPISYQSKLTTSVVIRVGSDGSASELSMQILRN